MKIVLFLVASALTLSGCANGSATTHQSTDPGSARNAHGAKRSFTSNQQ